MNIFFYLYSGWILLICVSFGLLYLLLYFFMHPIDSHHNTTLFMKLTGSNSSLWCHFWIDFCLNIFINMLSSGFQHKCQTEGSLENRPVVKSYVPEISNFRWAHSPFSYRVFCNLFLYICTS
jgi:hypothetical protein